jgi:hypothetical protein
LKTTSLGASRKLVMITSSAPGSIKKLVFALFCDIKSSPKTTTVFDFGWRDILEYVIAEEQSLLGLSRNQR